MKAKSTSLLLFLAALFWPHLASAKVILTFHSFSGSVLFGRFPHAFVSLDGNLDANGAPVHTNFGYATPYGEQSIFGGQFKPEIMVEKEDYLASTKRHFSVDLTDEEYGRVLAVVDRWKTLPYILKTRNCIHFVAAIARELSLKADVPDRLHRKPRAWLDYVATLNPQLKATSDK